ncbi:single-stranded-DNA-specific exonuclease RecJ [Patescibacteria group bacterium]
MRWQISGKPQARKTSKRREEIIALLSKNRGLKTKKQQENFFHPLNPLKIALRQVGISSVQMKKAIARVKKAIKNKEKIIVYGDYDADGICATAIVWEALDCFGAQAMPFIPQREEGYGLKTERVKQMASQGTSLIITVDQGIVHSRQVNSAKKIGVDVIVTDHHEPGKKKPSAAAVIHTTQLAGAGVAWFFARELLKGSRRPQVLKFKNEKMYDLDLATIGTITDMVPLLGASRSIVKDGLALLRKTKRLGLQALYDFALINKEKIGTYEVGFMIGPRLNAAGRMGDPLESLRLVCTRDENRAIALAQKVDQANRNRRTLMEDTTRHARNLWLEQDGQSPLIFVFHKNFEHGVVGLVASRLKDEFYRPAVVLGSRGENWVASARSIEEFSIVSAIRALKKHIGDHGGHRLAAGFSVSSQNLDFVRQGLVDQAKKKLDQIDLAPRLEVEAEVQLSDINQKLVAQINSFEPFGKGNPEPVLVVRNVQVTEYRVVGGKGRHLLANFQSPDLKQPIRGIGFGLGHFSQDLSSSDPVDIAFIPQINEWQGRKNLQLKIKDIKLD